MPGVTIGYISGGKQHDEFMMSCVRFLVADSRARKQYVATGNMKGPFHADNRDKLAATFLERTPAEWLMCIDTDIEFQPNDIYTLMDAAVAHNAKIVTGLYFIYHPEHQLNPAWYVYNPLLNNHEVYTRISSGMHKLDAAGAGFMLIHREAYLQIENLRKEQFAKRLHSLRWLRGRRKEFSWSDEVHESLEFAINLTQDQAEDPWKWYGHDIYRGGTALPSGDIEWKRTRAGEDITFCMRARACGIPIYGCGDVTVGHIKERKENLETYARSLPGGRVEELRPAQPAGPIDVQTIVNDEAPTVAIEKWPGAVGKS